MVEEWRAELKVAVVEEWRAEVLCAVVEEWRADKKVAAVEEWRADMKIALVEEWRVGRSAGGSIGTGATGGSLAGSFGAAAALASAKADKDRRKREDKRAPLFVGAFRDRSGKLDLPVVWFLLTTFLFPLFFVFSVPYSLLHRHRRMKASNLMSPKREKLEVLAMVAAPLYVALIVEAIANDRFSDFALGAAASIAIFNGVITLIKTNWRSA